MLTFTPPIVRACRAAKSSNSKNNTMATSFQNAGTFVANSAITAFRLVSISSNRGVGLAATASLPDGVALIDAASGDQISVQFLGGTTIKATLLAGPVTVGDTVFSTANGTVAITGTVTVGKSLTTATDASAIIELIVKNI
jgi:hypothetical protein